MIVALIDNGSLEPAAHRNLRAVASALATRCATQVHAVSWKHSDQIAPAALGGVPAWTLSAFVRSMVALGQREFLFVPFFISPQGAVGSVLRSDLEALRRQTGGFEYSFSEGLATREAIASIATIRVRETLAGIGGPASAVVVDHGGPSAASGALRDRLAAQIREQLGGAVLAVAAASMEGRHPPLLADQLQAPGFAGQDVVVVPLFLSPGRHAGPDGDIVALCRASPARCHVTGLIGTHPGAIAALAEGLHHALSHLPVPSPA